MRLLKLLSMASVVLYASALAAQMPIAQRTKLYTDHDIRKLAEYDIDRESTSNRHILDMPCLKVVPNGESHARTKVFNTLNIDEHCIQDLRHHYSGNVVFLTWRISPSYDICCMSATNDKANSGLALSDPNRRVYGIRLIKRTK